MTEQDWIEKSKVDGLYYDLTFFHDEWINNACEKNTLIVNYEDYTNNPQKTINSIESFFGLKQTEIQIETVKAKYSRVSYLDSIKQDLNFGIKDAINKIRYKLALRTRIKNFLSRIHNW